MLADFYLPFRAWVVERSGRPSGSWKHISHDLWVPLYQDKGTKKHCSRRLEFFMGLWLLFTSPFFRKRMAKIERFKVPQCSSATALFTLPQKLPREIVHCMPAITVYSTFTHWLIFDLSLAFINIMTVERFRPMWFHEDPLTHWKVAATLEFWSFQMAFGLGLFRCLQISTCLSGLGSRSVQGGLVDRESTSALIFGSLCTKTKGRRILLLMLEVLLRFGVLYFSFSLDEKETKNQVKNKLPPTGQPRPAFLTGQRFIIT